MSDGIEYPSDRDIAAIRSIDEARIPEYPAPVTAVDLDALDAARAAATPGPWRLGTHDGPDEGQEVLCTNGAVADTWEPADAALIVAAVNALPDLIADARKLRALRDAVMGLADRWDAIADGSTDPVARYVDRTAARSLRATVTAALGGES